MGGLHGLTLIECLINCCASPVVLGLWPTSAVLTCKYPDSLEVSEIPEELVHFVKTLGYKLGIDCQSLVRPSLEIALVHIHQKIA